MVASLWGGAVFVGGGSLDDNRDAAGTIAFVDNLFEIDRFDALAGPAFNGAINIVVRHTLRASRLNCAAKTRVSVRIAAAGFCGDGDLLGKLAEDLTAFCVDCAFETLDLRPLAMSLHIGFFRI